MLSSRVYTFRFLLSEVGRRDPLLPQLAVECTKPSKASLPAHRSESDTRRTSRDERADTVPVNPTTKQQSVQPILLTVAAQILPSRDPCPGSCNHEIAFALLPGERGGWLQPKVRNEVWEWLQTYVIRTDARPSLSCHDVRKQLQALLATPMRALHP
jgi:hypothetical protein